MSASRMRKAQLRLSRRGWLVVAVCGVMLSSFAADAVASIGAVRSGVSVGDLDLSGKGREEAERLLTERARLIAAEPVALTAADEELSVSPEDVGFYPDVDATLEEAMLVGRQGNVLVTFWQRFRSYFADTDIGWTSEVERDKVSELVNGWAERFDNPSQEAGIEARGERLVPVEPRTGHELDRRRAQRTLVGALESWPRAPVALPFATVRAKTDIADAREAAEEANQMVRAPIMVTGPDGGEVELRPDDLAPLLEAVARRRGDDWRLAVRFSPERVEAQLGERMKPFEREPRSAEFRAGGGSVSISPHEDGLEFDAAETAGALTEAARRDAPRTIEAAMKTAQPALTTEQAEALNIHELVSTFTTRHACCQPRVKNIHRMADIIDGTLIRPGETFSLNRAAGRRTTDRGFVDAPMIYDGEYRDDVGGGVSQFATTFFNAIFFGGYDVVSYKAHSYYISRYPPGREATISWPAPDVKFRNDTDSGILVRTGYTATSITVSFYGDDGGRRIRAEAGERTNFTDPPTQRKANPAMRPGSERVVQGGGQGFDIVVWRIFQKDGEVQRKERFFTRYRPEPRIIEYGPGDPEPTPEPSPPPEEEPPEPKPTPTPAPATPKPPATPEPEASTG